MPGSGKRASRSFSTLGKSLFRIMGSSGGDGGSGEEFFFLGKKAILWYFSHRRRFLENERPTEIPNEGITQR